MLRKNGKTQKRIKKLLRHVHMPAYADNGGILLPTSHPCISPGIRQSIYFGDYESKEIDIVSRKLAKDDVVMEIGAGIGFLSAYCARIVGSDRVFAYEANPALMEVIAATHAKNKVAPTVTNALLGEAEGEREFFLEPEFWASSLCRISDRATSIKVRQISLNAEMALRKPTFLIVDIEGGEYELFGFADLASVRKICLEVHPDVLGDARISEIFRRLFDQGFSLDFSCIRKNVFFLYREPGAARA
jgi:FkbM family methyltransferase